MCPRIIWKHLLKNAGFCSPLLTSALSPLPTPKLSLEVWCVGPKNLDLLWVFKITLMHIVSGQFCERWLSDLFSSFPLFLSLPPSPSSSGTIVILTLSHQPFILNFITKLFPPYNDFHVSQWTEFLIWEAGHLIYSTRSTITYQLIHAPTLYLPAFLTELRWRLFVEWYSDIRMFHEL